MFSNRILKTLLSMFFLAALCACGGKTDQPENKDVESADLLVCTFNIRYGSADDGDYCWDNRKDAVCKFINTRKPDIIGMQEVERSQAEYLNSQLGSDYGIYGIGRESGKDILQGVGTESANVILYKKSRFGLDKKNVFWHSDTPDQIVTKNKSSDYGSWHTSHPLNTVWVKLTDDQNLGRAVWLFVTHYQNNKNMTSVAPQIRMLESNLHLSQIPQISGQILGPSCQDAIFFVGDLNSTSSTDEVQRLINYPLGYARLDAEKSSFREISTNNDFGKGSGIIDHIFFSGPLKALNYTVDRRDYGIVYISDHYPVLSEFAYTDK